MKKSAENQEDDGCNTPATALQRRCRVALVPTEFGVDRKAVPLPPAEPRQRRKGRVASGDPVEQAILDRLYEAGDVLKRMPGAGIGEGETEREFALPTGAEIDRMDAVIGEWVFLLTGAEQRQVFGWIVSGLSLRRAADKDPHRRSPEGVRKAILALAAFLGRRLAEKWRITDTERLTNAVKTG